MGKGAGRDFRGGGADLAEEKKNKAAMGTRTQQSEPRELPGSNPQAPGSIGELMTPSTFGRSSPDSNPEEYERNVERNRSFLKSPETQAALMQFGVSLMGSAGSGDTASNISQAMALAAGAPGRMRQAQRKLDSVALDDQLAIERVGMERERLGMDQEELSMKKEQKQARKALFGSMKNATDDQLQQIANELAAEGDDEGARLALSMSRTAADPAITAKIQQYQFDVKQGFKGTMMEWEEAKRNISVIESLRQKKAAGIVLNPDEQAVYDDAVNADVLTRMFLEQNGELGTTTEPAPSSGSSGNVTFTVK